MNRVVITGIGVVSPLGSGEGFWNKLIAGKSGIKRIQRFVDAGFECQIGGEAAEIKDLGIEPREERRLDPFSLYALCAAREAIDDSGIKLGEENTNVGVLLGTGIGGMNSIEKEYERFMQRGHSRVSPLLVPRCMPNAASANCGLFYKLHGCNFSINSACASGLHAIIVSSILIERGLLDVILSGGSEATLTNLPQASFANMEAMTKKYNDAPEKASRPFDRERDGFVMSEGAGLLVLEDLEHARNRGAKIYAEIIGYGMNFDSYHITAPDPEGKWVVKCMQDALRESGIGPEEVDYINAHGTSTPLNDVSETRAIKKVFQEYAYKIPISSTKSMTGHLLGAAGGLETVICCLAMQHGILPPTINYENPDPECDLDYVPNKAREKDVSIVMNNGFGFGGHNACLVLKKFTG